MNETGEGVSGWLSSACNCGSQGCECEPYTGHGAYLNKWNLISDAAVQWVCEGNPCRLVCSGKIQRWDRIRSLKREGCCGLVVLFSGFESPWVDAKRRCKGRASVSESPGLVNPGLRGVSVWNSANACWGQLVCRPSESDTMKTRHVRFKLSVTGGIRNVHHVPSSE